MRQFMVLVARTGRLPLAYPLASGERALANMRTLASRGKTVIARTTANGITEDLTLPDMIELYADSATLFTAADMPPIPAKHGETLGLF